MSRSGGLPKAFAELPEAHALLAILDAGCGHTGCGHLGSGQTARGQADCGHTSALDALLSSQPTAPRPAQLDHLRYKPGTSLIARIAQPPGVQAPHTAPPWWFAAHTAPGAAAMAKVEERAESAGYPLARAVLPSGTVMHAGPAGTDKELFKPLLKAGLVDSRGEPMGQVLSYNPWRRLVMRRTLPGGERTVVRVWAAPPQSARLLTGMHDAGVRVLPTRKLTRSAIEQPWVAGGDLDAMLSARGRAAAHEEFAQRTVEQVAEALAGLHSSRLGMTEAQDGGLARLDIRRLLARARSGVEASCVELLPQFDDAAARVADALGEDSSAQMVLHGDFSADQVVLGERSGPWLIDLDRMVVGSAGFDLGAFAAVELIRGRGQRAAAWLLDAYTRQSGAARVDTQGLHSWTALHLLLRAMEPFRARHSEFHDRVGRRLRWARALFDSPRTVCDESRTVCRPDDPVAREAHDE